MAFKPMLSQIQGGVELRADVDTLKTSYDAAKVITTTSKGEGGGTYNADELLTKIQTDITSLDSKTQQAIKDAVNAVKNKVIKDVVRIQVEATYSAGDGEGSYNVQLPEDFDTKVPSANKETPVPVYELDNNAVIDETGAQITINLIDGTLSGYPCEVDEAASAGGTTVYKKRTESFDIKFFPVGTFTLDTLSEDYMLDNQELQLLSYDQAINKIITNLAQDQSLIDKISALIGEEAVAEQIKEKTDALQNQIDTLNGTVSGHTTSLADIATYVNKDSGLNANSKKVVNVLDGDVSNSSTDAVNGKQLFATKTELTSSIEAKDSAMNTRMVAVEGYVKAEGLDANNKKVINVADGEIAADNKEAINGGQLYTVKTTLEAADTAIQESVTTLEENVTTNHEALAGRVTAVEAYVKETGIDANSKKVVNVADATLEADNKDAVNGGQLFTVDAAYKAADISLQGNIDTLSETVESYHTELDDKIDGVDAKVDTNIADIAKLKTATVTIKVPKVHVDSFDMTGEAQTVFTLTAVPNEVKVMANINGIVYEEDTGAFTVDREQKTVTWAFGAGAGGFDLKNDIAEKVVIRYMVDEDVVTTLTIA
ncbi:hypothetical protein ACTQX2_00065 [Megamonas funiformis]|uniref:hypothetical protein n=1 Tax=Megamonas funiformis TaxID=437897 RepID=UPI003F96CC55